MLGLIDWGIGGIGVFREIKRLHPNLPVIYFSDTGVTPYGRMKRFELAARLDLVIEFLKVKGATEILIGCNAASTAISDLSEHGMKINGVIEAAVIAALRTRPTHLGVIGGRRTILSGIYRKRFAEHGIKTEQRIAQPLSALIEAGDTSSETLHAEASRILRPLEKCSHILLACTHYPAIEGILSGYVSSGTRFIDPAKELASRIRNLSDSTISDRFFTTGDKSAMKRAAKNAFGVSLDGVEKVRLSE